VNPRAAARAWTDKPVAICRLKRVAADNKSDDVRARLPKARRRRTARRIACIGAGPASLTVANDLMPLGYEVTIFEKQSGPVASCASNIPSFRLPPEGARRRDRDDPATWAWRFATTRPSRV
jgi:formate dehydrogenase beta subunit